jgi:hypothetical protein
MPVKIQVKRGSGSTLLNGVLSEGELGFTTDNKQVFVGDNNTDPILVGKSLIGTLSSRPSASTEGQLYLATDENRLYIDNGSSWSKVREPYSQEITQFRADDTNPPSNEVVGVCQTISFSGSSDNITWPQFITTDEVDDSKDINFRIAYTMSSSETSKSVSLNADVYVFSDGDDPTKSANVSNLEDEISVPSDTQIDKFSLTSIKVPASQLSGSSQVIVLKLWRDVDGVANNHSGNFRLISLKAHQ